MKSNRNLRKNFAAAALALCLAVGVGAVPAFAASPLLAPAITMPWSKTEVESIETGEYDASMLCGTTQQLSPVITPSRAARRNEVTYQSDSPSVITVTEDGVAEAVGLGTANITATAGEQTCTYTITSEPDSTMIVTEMDLTLASSTITVGENTSVSLAVLPTTAANYASVSLSSSNEAVATVNNFGKVTGISAGSAVITATCGDVTASATVKVVSSASSTTVTQTLTLNTNYIVLKPGASATITGKVSPSSARQSLTFKSQDSKVATVNGSGVVTGVGTGATSIVVSNGTTSASVAIIVNQNASASSENTGNGENTGTENTVTDPVLETIRNADDASDEIVVQQKDVPVITSDMLNALGTSGKTLVVDADSYTLRLAGSDIKDTSATVDTALAFADSEYGQTFTLNGGNSLPCTVEVTLTGEQAGYSRLYLYNAVTEKWQYLNTYQDGVLHVDTAGDYLLTNQNLRFSEINWAFFIAAGITVAACLVVYIAVKKRYWFW